MARKMALALWFLATLSLAGCASRGPACHLDGESMVRTELYFGRSMPGGQQVSAAQWAGFLESEVTPRFRQGLTVLDANGQWLAATGKVVKERTKLLILIYPDTPGNRSAIGEIIDAYKRRFKQQAVLRVAGRVGVSF